MNQFTGIEDKIAAYLQNNRLAGTPILQERTFDIRLLARGEYNLNYLLTSRQDAVRLVFRINIGTQINRDDQIIYEFKALQLLQDSGVTPLPFFVDDSREFFNQGVSIIEYLPGEPLDYERDLAAAARLFSIIHQTKVPQEKNHLIVEQAPLSLIFKECCGLLETYFHSDHARPEIKSYLQEVKDWADENRRREKYFQNDPWLCIVNTEVNSGNFIVNRQKETIHLIDWEMPRWGDPSQDLSHFCSPLTTLWKSRYRMSPEDKTDFMNAYKENIADPHVRDTLDERVRLRDPFVYLRGISWSAMGWVAYQTEYQGIKNPDTWRTLQRYMQLDFIRSLFDPFLKLSNRH